MFSPGSSPPASLLSKIPSSSPHPIQNHERETALHCAAQYGHLEVVSVLLQELTDPTMRNSRQETPLDLAALYGRLQVGTSLLFRVEKPPAPFCWVHHTRAEIRHFDPPSLAPP